MENPFKKIVHNDQLPELIKQKVMDDINIIKLALDVTGLLAIKYPKTIEQFFLPLNIKNKLDDKN